MENESIARVRTSMKILITHVYNSFNYGSAMMAINMIYYLKENLKRDIEFYLDSRTDFHLERIKDACRVKDVFRIDFEEPEYKKHKNKIINTLSKPYKALQTYKGILDFCKYVERFDAMIVLGGDDLSEYYSKISLIFQLIRLKKCSKILPTFLVGQTIGPFTSVRKKLAAKCLKDCIIYTRDPLTTKYVSEKLELAYVKESADLAFLELPFQKDCNDSIIKDFGLTKNNYITLVPSALIRCYCNSKENYLRSWETIAYELIRKKELENKKIVLLPHVLGINGDQIIIKGIIKKIGKKYSNRIIAITDEPLSYNEARYILGNGYFSITGRMHAAISTFKMLKPAISLSYSVKYSGVIGLGLDMNELIIESSNDEIWSSGEIVNKVLEKVDYVLENYDEIKNKISKNMTIMKKKVIDQIMDISKRIEG